MNGDSPVTWDKYNEHLEDVKEGYARLGRLEAEVMGDLESGRPSLRHELGARIDKTNTILKAIGIPIIIAIVVKIVMDWYLFQPTLSQLRTLETWKTQQEEKDQRR